MINEEKKMFKKINKTNNLNDNNTSIYSNDVLMNDSTNKITNNTM